MTRKNDIPFYMLAVLLGLAAGFTEITISDLLVTAIVVMFATMVLGFLRPQNAWRWTLIVAAFVPLLRLAAYLFLGQRSDRAQIWESALGFVTGAVGAYAGVLGRLGVDTLFRERGEEPARPEDRKGAGS
jgi:cell division protein FtsW (lipid II flippase)